MSDREQEGEETGHKKRKKGQQVDLEGDEVKVAEGWTIDNEQTRGLKAKAVGIAKRIPNLRHIDTDDLQTVIAHKEKRVSNTKKKENIQIFAECMKPRPVFVAIAHSQQSVLGPFVIVFYPPFFEEPPQRQEQIIIHELYHIKLNENNGKKSLRPHSGFGDEQVVALQKKYLVNE